MSGADEKTPALTDAEIEALVQRVVEILRPFPWRTQRRALAYVADKLGIEMF